MDDTPSFTSLYQCVPTWRAEDEALWRLAREYHERAEAFDERLCHARDKRGRVVPQGAERALCSRHALAVRGELLERARVWSRDLGDAIRADVERFESDWRRGVRHFVSPITHPLHSP